MSRKTRADREWKVAVDELGIFYTHRRRPVLIRFARFLARANPDNDYYLYQGFILYRKRRVA